MIEVGHSLCCQRPQSAAPRLFSHRHCRHHCHCHPRHYYHRLALVVVLVQAVASDDGDVDS